MTTDDALYSIGDLAGLVGATPRTVRYYVAQGLLPPPSGTGPGAHYTDEHLERLRLIQRLQRQHQPLSEIRQRLAALGAREVSALVADAEEPPAPADSALDYLRAVLAAPGPSPATVSPSAPAPAPAIASTRPSGGVPRAMAALSRQTPGFMPRMRDVEPPPPRPAALLAEAAVGYDVPTDLAPADPAPAELRSQWDRIGLTPNIEIHVRRPLGRLENRRVERLITIARQLLREERP